ncbi:hypothetical protein [Haladaptatus sp. DFWS20]|uniref:hypothetical protein n=1 Tax=Haladaptatus sp. DFWS20 TaxID=3403467 RepID=UPI003EBC810A
MNQTEQSSVNMEKWIVALLSVTMVDKKTAACLSTGCATTTFKENYIMAKETTDKEGEAAEFTTLTGTMILRDEDIKFTDSFSVGMWRIGIYNPLWGIGMLLPVILTFTLTSAPLSRRILFLGIFYGGVISIGIVIGVLSRILTNILSDQPKQLTNGEIKIDSIKKIQTKRSKVFPEIEISHRSTGGEVRIVRKFANKSQYDDQISDIISAFEKRGIPLEEV